MTNVPYEPYVISVINTLPPSLSVSPYVCHSDKESYSLGMYAS